MRLRTAHRSLQAARERSSERKATRGREKESLQRSLINFHLYFAQTKANTIGRKMTFRKSTLNLRGKYGDTTKPVLCRRSLNSLRKRKPGERRKSLSPSVRDNCRLCGCSFNVTFVSFSLLPKCCLFNEFFCLWGVDCVLEG